MATVVLIQCRSLSSRLPGKALLPVAGMPSAVLCARRAANTGLDVRIVTSNDVSDDVLCAILEEAKIPFFRGSLNNVLKRFADALSGLPDGTIVVRLTADNLLVDGSLVEEMVLAFKKIAATYLASHPTSVTGTPYGLSVEVTTAKALREASKNARTEEELEHVTPYIRRRYGLATHRPADLQGDLSRLRCTLDHWGDYRNICQVFNGIVAPVNAPWQMLCERLRNAANAAPYGVPKRFSKKGEIAELALGTAQLGLSYGVANRTGQPNFETAQRIVETAIRAGISHIDCARAYGDAEERLGRIISPALNAQVMVVTKLSPLPELHENMNVKDVQAHVAASVYHSCRDLNLRCLPILLLHRWEHRHSNSERIWVHLKQLQAEGVIGQLGTSVQSSADALAALSDPDISFVQLPFNILDRRLQVAGVPEKVHGRRDVTVQARSVFLQGLLLSPLEDWPKLAEVDSASVVGSLENLCSALDRESVADLCLAYVRAQSWIDCLVVGVETPAQLQENIRLMQDKPLNDRECKRVEMCFKDLADGLLNPALWPKNLLNRCGSEP